MRDQLKHHAREARLKYSPANDSAPFQAAQGLGPCRPGMSHSNRNLLATALGLRDSASSQGRQPPKRPVKATRFRIGTASLAGVPSLAVDGNILTLLPDHLGRSDGRHRVEVWHLSQQNMSKL
jgi:hypothetical protein